MKRFLLIFLVASLLPAAPAAARQLETAIVASDPFYGADADLAFSRARGTGATTVKLQLSWREVAPEGATKPAGFDPTNPFAAEYRWGGFDRLVQRAVENGLKPFIGISDAPTWAETVTGGRADRKSVV